MKILSGSKHRWWMVAAAAVVLYAGLGYFLAPAIVRTQIEQRASAVLHRKVSIDRVRIDPFALSIAIEGFRVDDPDGGPLLSWGRMYANFSAWGSLFRWRWQLSEVILEKPAIRLSVNKSGVLNIGDLVEPSASTPNETSGSDPAGAALPAVGIGRLEVDAWSVAFSDHSRRRPFETIAGPMTFVLTDFSTEAGTDSPYLFSGKTNSDETFEWSGTLSAAPLGSKGRIALNGFVISKHMPLVESLVPVEIPSGQVALALGYELVLAGDPVMRLTDISFALTGLEVRHPGADVPSVELARMELNVPEADLMARTAHVASVSVTGLDLHVERRADGSIDLLDFVPQQDANATATAADERGDPGPAPSVAVDEVLVAASSVTIDDKTTPRPAQLSVGNIGARITNAGTDLAREVGVDLTLQWAKRGGISVKGAVRPLPLAARLEVKVDSFDLRPFNPYVEAIVSTRMISADARLAGRIDLAQSRGRPLELRWAGEAAMENFSLVDLVEEEPWVGFRAIEIPKSEFTLEPMAFSAEEIVLRDPSIHVTLDEHGVPNLTGLLAPPNATAAPVQTPPAAPAPGDPGRRAVDASIGIVRIENGRARFDDRSFSPGYSTALTEFGGTVKGLSSDKAARADVDIRGRIDGSSTLAISGSVNPLADQLYTDLKLALSNVEMTRFAPYTGRFLGRAVDKGKLRFDIDCKVADDAISASNHLVLDQFFLGGDVPSPEAIKLPIGLALGLLRDPEGKIDLDLPVSGRLDDPDFKYGHIVWQALRNIVVKAATAPFSFIASRFGGDKVGDLRYLVFPSGSSDLTDAARKKGEVLARMMSERPSMRLEISALPSPEGDREGLTELKYRSLLLAEKRHAAGDGDTATESSPADVTGFDASEEEPLLRLVFARLFPGEAAQVLSVSAPASDTPGAAADLTASGADKPDGLLSRLWRRVRGRGDQAGTRPAETVAPESAAATAPEGAPAMLSVDEMRARVRATITVTDADFAALAAERAQAVQAALLALEGVEANRVFLVATPKDPKAATAAAGEGGRVVFGIDGS